MAQDDRADVTTDWPEDAGPHEQDVDGTAYGVGPAGSDGATVRGLSRGEQWVGTRLDQEGRAEGMCRS